MWAKIDPSIKTRLEAEYQKNKIEAAKEKEDYEAQYGKIERKKKKKHDKNKDKDEWFQCHLPSYYASPAEKLLKRNCSNQLQTTALWRYTFPCFVLVYSRDRWIRMPMRILIIMPFFLFSSLQHSKTHLRWFPSISSKPADSSRTNAHQEHPSSQSVISPVQTALCLICCWWSRGSGFRCLIEDRRSGQGYQRWWYLIDLDSWWSLSL